MRVFIYIIIVLAFGLLVFNFTKVDFSHPFNGDSSVALIGVLAAACAIVLMLLLLISKEIARKQRHK